MEVEALMEAIESGSDEALIHGITPTLQDLVRNLHATGVTADKPASTIRTTPYPHGSRRTSLTTDDIPSPMKTQNDSRRRHNSHRIDTGKTALKTFGQLTPAAIEDSDGETTMTNPQHDDEAETLPSPTASPRSSATSTRGPQDTVKTIPEPHGRIVKTPVVHLHPNRQAEVRKDAGFYKRAPDKFCNDQSQDIQDWVSFLEDHMTSIGVHADPDKIRCLTKNLGQACRFEVNNTLKPEDKRSYKAHRAFVLEQYKTNSKSMRSSVNSKPL